MTSNMLHKILFEPRPPFSKAGIVKKNPASFLIIADDSCPICVEPFGSERLFHSECCNNVLHTSCLRPYVYNAGTYYLKCPFCQNVRKFKQLVAKYAGIHIPTREPTYEDHDRMVVELVCCYENCPDPDL